MISTHLSEVLEELFAGINRRNATLSLKSITAQIDPMPGKGKRALGRQDDMKASDESVG